MQEPVREIIFMRFFRLVVLYPKKGGPVPPALLSGRGGRRGHDGMTGTPFRYSSTRPVFSVFQKIIGVEMLQVMIMRTVDLGGRGETPHPQKVVRPPLSPLHFQPVFAWF